MNQAPPSKLKPAVWVGSSKKDLKEFPDEVQDEFGHDLYQAQQGAMPESAKPLRGFGGATVLELVGTFSGNAYRCVYTVRFETALYVLHAFQKKSHKGRKTDQRDIELIDERLKAAEKIEAERKASEERKP